MLTFNCWTSYFNINTNIYVFYFLANHHVTKTIEITRVNLFNIITQYRAIFNDEESMPASLKNEVNENIIFFTWINDKVFTFTIYSLNLFLNGLSLYLFILDCRFPCDT